MNQSDEFSEAFEGLASPFVESPAPHRCQCQSQGMAGAGGIEETEAEVGGETEATETTEGTESSEAEWEQEASAFGELEEEARYDEAEFESEGEFENKAVPGDLRSRVASVAAREWQRWGQGTRSETEAAMRPALRAYWRTLVKPAVVESQIDTGKAWSAAFISYVLRTAGAGDAFTGEPAHYLYIRHAKQARGKRDASKYQAFRITEAKPQVGDILCRDRGEKGKCGGTNYDNVNDGNYHATHCDVVTAVRNGSITIIGGNVSGPRCRKSGCTVHARTATLDNRGLVIAGQGSCRYFAILKAPQAAKRIAAVPTPSVVKAPFAIASPRGYRLSGGKRRGQVRAVVVHTTGAGLAAQAATNQQGRGRGCTTPLDCGLEYYAGPGKEGFPNYLIGYDGTIYCTCPEDYVAWHAGWTQAMSAAFGSGSWSAPTWWSSVWSPRKSPLELVPRGTGPNSHSVGIELLGDARSDAGYTEQQYRALARLVVDVDRRHGIGITRAPSVKLLGHEDLNPLTGEGGRADRLGGWDPGAHRPKPRFLWPKLWALVEQGRTARELEYEGGETEFGEAESELASESWESESLESEELEREWEVANE